MKNLKSFISKITIVFCMALVFGILGHTNVQAAVTWNSNDKNSDFTLSNNNLTANISTINGAIRATKYVRSGKWYWEIKIDADNDRAVIGVSNNLYNTSTENYNSTNVKYYYGFMGHKFPGDVIYGDSYKKGDVISVLLDMDNGKLEFWKNGVPQGVSHTNLLNWGSEVSPTIGLGASVPNITMTANFGSTVFKYNPPEGFLAYDNNSSSSGIILSIEPEKNKIKLNEIVSASLTIDNIKDIAAEDVRIKYDSSKLQFVSIDEVDGIKLVKSDTQPGELRVIVASKGVANVVNAKKALLKLNFKGIAAGDALVDVTKGRVSDGITIEKDLTDKQCGQATITIEDSVLKDVNNSGEFTLLDLAIDGRHYGENPKLLTQYNTDIVVNNAIDNDDLTKIAEYMIANPNYKF